MACGMSCSLQLNELSATQDLDNAGLCLILYEMHSGNKYTLRAPSLSIRDAWFSRLLELISANKLKKDSHKRNTLEPVEPFSRSPSIPRKLPFRRDREASKKSKHLQVESTLSYPGSMAATDDTEVGFIVYFHFNIYVFLGPARNPIFGFRTNCDGRWG